MNIFYFSNNSKQCAMEHADRHVVKMIVEYAQLLSTAHRVLDGKEITIIQNNRKKKIWKLEDEDFDDMLYAATHVNHPSAKWTRNSANNYSWLYNLWASLLTEYTRRYGKIHATSRLQTYLLNGPTNIPHNIPFKSPWRAMPEQYKHTKQSEDYCELSYQDYFNGEKQHIAKWKNTDPPSWYVPLDI